LDSGNSQYGYVGEDIQNPLSVMVTDRFGNPVSGISINFEIVSGDANIEGGKTKTVVSNVSGRASVTVTLGYTTGTVTVEAKNGITGHIYFEYAHDTGSKYSEISGRVLNWLLQIGRQPEGNGEYAFR
jgi:hypothetical protein